MNLISKLAVNSKTSNIKGNVELFVSKCNVKGYYATETDRENKVVTPQTLSISFTDDITTLDLQEEYRGLNAKKRLNKAQKGRLEELKAELSKKQYVFQTVYVGKYMSSRPNKYQAYFASRSQAQSLIENFVMKFITIGDSTYNEELTAIAEPFITALKDADNDNVRLLILIDYFRALCGFINKNKLSAKFIVKDGKALGFKK